MTTERWDPFRELMSLRDSMERVFQDNFVRIGGTLSALNSIPIDVGETDHGYSVRASIPGVRPEDIDVEVQGNLVTIRAEQSSDEETSSQNWFVRERRVGALQRSFTLPSPVDAEKAEAKIEHGVLELRLPRVGSASPRRIRVGAASSTGQGAAAASSEGTSGQDAAREEHSEDRVAEESDQSFPASDPPSWTPERV